MRRPSSTATAPAMGCVPVNLPRIRDRPSGQEAFRLWTEGLSRYFVSSRASDPIALPLGDPLDVTRITPVQEFCLACQTGLKQGLSL